MKEVLIPVEFERQSPLVKRLTLYLAHQEIRPETPLSLSAFIEDYNTWTNHERGIALIRFALYRLAGLQMIRWDDDVRTHFVLTESGQAIARTVYCLAEQGDADYHLLLPPQRIVATEANPSPSPPVSSSGLLAVTPATTRFSPQRTE